MNEYIEIIDNSIKNVRQGVANAEQSLNETKAALRKQASDGFYDEHAILSAVNSVRYAKEQYDAMDILLNNLISIREKMLTVEAGKEVSKGV